MGGGVDAFQGSPGGIGAARVAAEVGGTGLPFWCSTALPVWSDTGLPGGCDTHWPVGSAQPMIVSRTPSTIPKVTTSRKAFDFRPKRTIIDPMRRIGVMERPSSTGRASLAAEFAEPKDRPVASLCEDDALESESLLESERVRCRSLTSVIVQGLGAPTRLSRLL